MQRARRRSSASYGKASRPAAELDPTVGLTQRRKAAKKDGKNPRISCLVSYDIPMSVNPVVGFRSWRLDLLGAFAALREEFFSLCGEIAGNPAALTALSC